MKTIAFAIAALSAIAAAQEAPAMDAEDSSFVGKIKAWNCATCTMAFKGLDKFLDSDTFQKPI